MAITNSDRNDLASRLRSAETEVVLAAAEGLKTFAATAGNNGHRQYVFSISIIVLS